jgi:phosphate transport system substrate-binding protein
MKLSTTVLNRVVTSSVVASAVAFAPLAAFGQAVTLNGAGATFPAPLYQRYAREIKKDLPNISINYQGIGSSGGINQVIAGTVDFGGSDSAMTDAQIAQVKRGVILVPTAGGAVSVVYNVPGVTNLRLSRSTLPAIFSGQITNWSDAKIKADNPGVNLPNLPIKAVVRADGSGTTFIFTNHLSAINSYFKGRIGASNSPKWTLPGALRGRGNPGVAQLVGRTQGSIGYVEYDFAVKNKLRSAAVQNKQRQYVSPSLQTANAALSGVQFPSNYRVFVADPNQGYPIVGLTWIMVYRQYPNAAKANAVKQMVEWILTKGQQYNDDNNYTSIPRNVGANVINTVKSNVR